MPTWAAMARAVGVLSPVSISVRTPSACSSAMAAALVGLTVSATAASASTRLPSVRPITLLPWRSSSSMRASSASLATPASRIRRRLPSWKVTPSITPATPRPGRAAKSATSSS